MNTHAKLMPNGHKSTFDYGVRLQNVTGHVVVEVNKQGVFLVDGLPFEPAYKPLTTEELREVLAIYFAE